MAEVEANDRSGIAPPAGYRERYPWHERPWEILTRDLERLPHAVLLHGPAGLGKTDFAWRLAHMLLCDNRGGEMACGTCASCALVAAGTHPDLLSIAPLEDAAGISVDQVREVKDFLNLTAHRAHHKVVILSPAEAMNINGANALLKVLEEPPAGSLLLLASTAPGRLPATIRSRTSAVAFPMPSPAEALAWLVAKGIEGALAQAAVEQSGGGPLAALAQAKSADAPDPKQLLQDVRAMESGREDPMRCAAKWKEAGAQACLSWFQRYVAGLIREQSLAGSGQSFSFKLSELHKFLDTISDAKLQLDGPLDQTLLLEDTLIGWCRISRRIG